MPRVEFNTPNVYIFSKDLSIRFKDVNTAKHMGYDHLVSLLQEARIAFFMSYGFDELNARPIGFIIADLAVQYKSEAFYNDNITIDIAIDDIKEKSLDIHYRVTHKTNHKVIALAKTGVVFFDKDKKRPSPIPKNLLSDLTIK